MITRISAVLLLLLVAAACTSSGGRQSNGDDGPPPWVASGARYAPPRLDKSFEPASGWLESACRLPRVQLRRIFRGQYLGRSPELQIVPREPNFFGHFIGQVHSGPWSYLQDVPLVFYGPGFIRRTGAIKLPREVTVADIAPTFAELLGVEPPNPTGPPLSEILVPADERPGRPRLIVTIVWDGGGNNVLNAWPGTWPDLKSLMRRGASITGATVGSSPSVTPAIHTNIGTGTFPDEHGIIGILQRDEAGRLTSPFPRRSAGPMILPALADTYDLATGNAALVGMIAFKNWHLGMIGHGADWPGGDKDIAAIITQTEELGINTEAYSLPSYLEQVPGLERTTRRIDLDDGKLDSKWMGHEMLAEPSPRRDTPVWALQQTRIIKALFEREGFGKDAIPDLFYTNYKQLDEIGHGFNMLLPEMKPSIEYLDGTLGDLERFLNDFVGRNRWVMVVTADHGQGPLAEASGAWPIQADELVEDIGAHFGVDSEEIVKRRVPTGVFVNNSGLESNAISLEEISDFLIEYRMGDNVSKGFEFPNQYRERFDEPLFSAVFPADQEKRIMACSRTGDGLD